MRVSSGGLKLGAALMALSVGGCTYAPLNVATSPVGYAAVPAQRDTRPVARSIASKPAPAPARPAVFQLERGRAVFDEGVAANQGIGSAAPDFSFRLVGTTINGWESTQGDLLYVEGEGRDAIQYLVVADSDTPLLIATHSTVYIFDEWDLIGAFTPSGTPLSPAALIAAQDEAQLLLVRGRTIHRASSGELTDEQPSYAQTTYAPVVSTVSWSPWLYAGWGGFDPWYDRYRGRRESRDRHDRWRDHGRRRGDRHGRDGRDGRHDGANARPPRGPEMARPRPQPRTVEGFEPTGTAPPGGELPPTMNRPPRERPSAPPAGVDRSGDRGDRGGNRGGNRGGGTWVTPPPPVTPAPSATPTPAFSAPPQPQVSVPQASAPPPPPPPRAAPPPPSRPSRTEAPRVSNDSNRGDVRPD
jgi:hypothetical protein